MITIVEYINKDLTNFKKKINLELKKKKINLDLKIVFEITKSNFNSKLCHAKINNRQCSRKWKFVIDGNCLCGLHKSNKYSVMNKNNKNCFCRKYYINNF